MRRWSLMYEREQLGLSLRQLGRLTGINYSAICNIENGITTPRKKTKEILSRFFPNPKDELFELSEFPSQFAKNKCVIHGEITIIYVKHIDDEVSEVIIDTEEIEKLRKYPIKWHVRNIGTSRPYVSGRKILDHEGKTYSLHRIIMDAPDDLMVDHINHDTLDNRKSNLRLATRIENSQNYHQARVNSNSGVLGVIWVERLKKWTAQVNANGKKISLGSFDTILEAAEVVKMARAKYLPYSQEALHTDSDEISSVIDHSRPRSHNKSSGLRNISLHKKSNKWKVQIRIKGESYYGLFLDLEDAKKAAVTERQRLIEIGILNL